MRKYTHYIGLDVPKDTISVALAKSGRAAPTFYGQIASTPAALSQLVSRLATKPGALSFCYEAGPCGYGAYRQLQSMGYPCQVVAPSLIPRKPGDRLKTDRRDALQLARLHRSGDLTPVWVPDQEQEAIRDLVRCREDMKGIERHARQRLCGFLLRHGQVYGGKSRWTVVHFRWLAQVRLDHPAQQIVLQEYIDTVQAAQNRVSALEKEMAQTVESWSLAPVVEGLMALRGVALITAMTIVAELGDLTRFDSPRPWMAYLGLVPSEASSGHRRRQGAINKTGNGHVRRVLVEAAWSYRFAARKSPHLQKKAQQTSEAVQAIAWKAQKRLARRYRRLQARGKLKTQTCVAVARELVGFIWAIVWQVMRPQEAPALLA